MQQTWREDKGSGPFSTFSFARVSAEEKRDGKKPKDFTVRN